MITELRNRVCSVAAVALMAFMALSTAQAQTALPWSQGRVGQSVRPANDGRAIEVDVFSYAPERLRETLRAAPQRNVGFEGAIRFLLPAPDGSLVEFALVERPTLAPALRARRPELRTYVGISVEEPGLELRLSFDGSSIIASVLGADGWSLDSTPVQTAGRFQIWRNADDPSSGPGWCESIASFESGGGTAGKVDSKSNGTQLRTYEFAITGTGEFTVYHLTIANAEAQIVQLVNVVNSILERDLAARLQLVDINLYADPATDPFSDGLTPNEISLNENQDALDAKLGSNNYELGHVVSRYNQQGWRGLAQSFSQCDRFGKARGATYAATPTSGALVEGLLHECGHQLGSEHSFNGTAGSCGGNRYGPSAYEIASGVSAMSYASICGSENVLTGTRIAMYNSGALESIIAQMASKSNCGTLSATANIPPVADAGPDLTIPRETAFVLDGSGSFDADADPLTYSWEQHDLGPASPPYGPAAGPLFRNFAANASPLRSVPNYSSYRIGVPAAYEFLPTVDRQLTFRLIVRDRQLGVGGIGWDTAVLTVSGEPFRILSPNGGQAFEAGAEVPVSWQVGGGSVAQNVRILFSADRGVSWTELESNTPNDGSHTVRIPCQLTSEARLRLEPTDNIFFDISNADFAITADVTPPSIVCPAPFSVEATSPEGIDKDDPALADWIASAQIVDACDSDPTLSVAAAQTIPIGTNQIALLVTDDSGNFNFCTAQLTVTEPTATEPPGLRTALLEIRPNPFNPSTTVVFQLARPQNVRLEIYDLRGRRVEVPLDAPLGEGRHEISWDASGQPSGVYIARLSAADGNFERRIALVK